MLTCDIQLYNFKITYIYLGRSYHMTVKIHATRDKKPARHDDFCQESLLSLGGRGREMLYKNLHAGCALLVFYVFLQYFWAHTKH